jgi:hypothetical protein
VESELWGCSRRRFLQGIAAAVAMAGWASDSVSSEEMSAASSSSSVTSSREDSWASPGGGGEWSRQTYDANPPSVDVDVRYSVGSQKPRLLRSGLLTLLGR